MKVLYKCPQRVGSRPSPEGAKRTEPPVPDTADALLSA